MKIDAAQGPLDVVLLRSEHLLVRLDPAHGGELLDLVDLRSGRQLLGRPPFRPADPLPGELDEESWTLRYRGGWQLAIPNVCNECQLDGRRYGFHGSGSVDAWHVVAHSQSEVAMRWAGHGLEASRRVTISGAELHIACSVRAVERPTPMIALEHCTVGLEVLDPDVALRLPSATAYEVSDLDGPTAPPPESPNWPYVRLLNGQLERSDAWPITKTRSRWIVLHNVPEGTAEVRNARHGTGLKLEWDAATLPHLHVWHEAGGTDRFWRRRARILGVEPTNVPHGLGLAEAVKAGQAPWVQPGQPVHWWMTARALP